MNTRACGLLALMLVAGSASAEEPSRVAVRFDTIGAISLTRARTQGGLGGSLGVTYALDANWLVQGRVAWLWGLGSHTLLRAGAGWHPSGGTWQPLFGADLVLGLGGALDFGIDGGVPTRAPTVGVVVGASLLRFRFERVTLSLLELEAGVSTEFLSVGPRVGVGILSLALAL